MSVHGGWIREPVCQRSRVQSTVPGSQMDNGERQDQREPRRSPATCDGRRGLAATIIEKGLCAGTRASAGSNENDTIRTASRRSSPDAGDGGRHVLPIGHGGSWEARDWGHFATHPGQRKQVADIEKTEDVQEKLVRQRLDWGLRGPRHGHGGGPRRSWHAAQDLLMRHG